MSQSQTVVAASPNDFVITHQNIKEIWGKSKPRQALVEHLQWFFRPHSSLDPERIDYNALLILAEF